MFRIIVITIIATVFCSAQGSVLLVGGGGENYNDWSDIPYRWLVDHAPNKKVLVMHYSTTSSFMPGYFISLGAASSTNLVVSSVTSANDSANYKTILEYDGIFLRGGDQWQYVSKWKGTLVEQAIKEVYLRGGVVGGSSAGEAVLSKVIFDAQITSTNPQSALRNPLGSGVTFTEDFLGFVPGILADTHFYERGRLGRLVAMLALYKTQKGKEIIGVGVDYNTAMGVTSDGVGEVMGAGTVTILRFTPNTTYVLESSKPLSLKNMRFDQLTKGFTFNITTGDIIAPPTALAYSPNPVSFPASTFLLDGSGKLTDWFGSTGSMKRFQSYIVNATDTVGIFSSPVAQQNARSVDSCFNAWNVRSRLLFIDDSKKNDPAFASLISGCKGFVFVGNNPDSAARLFDAGTASGNALRTSVAAGIPSLFLSNDAILAADTGANKLEFHIYGAYYGYLTLSRGIGLLKGATVIPRLYENADYIDNRASGLFWSLAKGHSSFGILLDVGSHISIDNATLRPYGLTPAMVIDAREVNIVDFPTWKDPGKANPRQNAAIIGTKIHVLRPNDSLDLSLMTLPVEWDNFSFFPSHIPIRLTWRTATEINNYGFEIEKKTSHHGGSDGWDVVGFVEGHGTTNVPHEYLFIDKASHPGKYCYRLKQIDNNGNVNYGTEITVTVQDIPRSVSLNQNYPNPFNPSTNISYELQTATSVTLKVFDLLGREIAQLVNARQPAGIFSVEFQASNLASGLYIYRLETEETAITKKMYLIK